MRRFLNSPKSTPLLFAIITIFAYGLLLTKTGFYWDDWPFAWIAKFIGPHEFIPAFAPFRPFLGPIFFVTTSLIPPVPLYWQIFALVIRFVIGLSAWWVFRQIWPEHPRAALTASLLMLVFPGYSQHWVALTHINQELIPFIFYLLSFGFTFKALRSERPLAYTIIALILQTCGIFPTEYFFTTEALRFLFLLFYFQENFWGRLRKTFRVWWPYLLIWILNAAWLVYYYKFGDYNSYGIALDDTTTASTLSLIAIPDVLFKVGFYIWVQILVLVSQTITAPSTLGTLALIILAFIFIAYYFLKLNSQTILAKDDFVSRFANQAIIIGLLGILLGRIPSWAANLPLNLQSTNDRFMVSMMIGGSLFLLGMIDLIKHERAKIYMTALLIALGIGQQFFNANIFRRDWEKQRELYWQMAWRIPDLQPGTLILTNELPVEYETDFSATAVLNWLYAPEYQPLNDLPYALIYTRTRLGGSKLPDLKPGTATIFPYRTVTFHGNTSASVTIYASTSGCLRVLESVYANDLVYERYTRFLRSSIPLSDPTRIFMDKNMPAMPKDLFGEEPAHTWCYFYEKAELARQAGDWKKVSKLGNEAINQGYSPSDPFEWLPFIEGFALTNDITKAEKYTIQAFNADNKPGNGLCQLWKRVQVQDSVGNGAESTATKILSEFGCIP